MTVFDVAMDDPYAMQCKQTMDSIAIQSNLPAAFEFAKCEVLQFLTKFLGEFCFSNWTAFRVSAVTLAQAL